MRRSCFTASWLGPATRGAGRCEFRKSRLTKRQRCPPASTASHASIATFVDFQDHYWMIARRHRPLVQQNGNSFFDA
eukprot:4855050-Pleurochrysis_carterae.AAC.1